MSVKNITLSNEAAIAIETSWEIRQNAITPHINKFNARLLDILTAYGLKALPTNFNVALFKPDGTPIRPLVFSYEEEDSKPSSESEQPKV